MNRLIFLAFAAPFIAAAVYLDLSYLGMGILSGLAFALFSLVFETDDLNPLALGVILLGIGGIALLAAVYYSNLHGLSFEGLSNARNLSRFIRRMPYYAVGAKSGGVFLCAYARWASGSKEP